MRAHWRTVAGLTLLVVIAAIVIGVATQRPGSQAALSFTSTKADGAQAIAKVLDAHGVSTVETTKLARVQHLSGRNRTLLVINPDFLGADQVRDLTSHARRVVLVQPSSTTLQALGLAITATNGAVSKPVAPGCDWPAARNAGSLQLDGVGYRAGSVAGLTTCYPVRMMDGGTAHSVLVNDDYLVLGSDLILRNDSITDEGRAALAVWMLGAEPEVVQYRVDPFDPAVVNDGEQSPQDLLPEWLDRVQWWLVGVAVLAVVWAGRRFGRLVPEPLPVVVRSAETARGRAALYRAAGAHRRAAEVLRADAVRRLGSRCGLAPHAPVELVAQAVAASIDTDHDWVVTVLAGPPPTGDAGLVALLADLDQLESHTRKASL